MIFYLLASINMALTLFFCTVLVYYRNNPMISNRDWPLILFPTIFMSTGAYLNAIAYELYFDNYPNWGVACRYLISWVIILLPTLNTAPILCRAYNIQFKYYMNQEKAKMSAAFYYNWKHTATLKWNMYFLICYFLLWNIPTLIIYLLVPFPADPANVTQCFDYFTWILVVQGTPLTFGLNYLLMRFRKLKDPYKIKTEFGVQFATGLLLFDTWLVIQIYDTATGGMNFPREFQPMYLITLFCFNVTFCNLVYPCYLAWKETKLDLGIEFQTSSAGSSRRNSNEITVRTILENDTLFEAFKDTTIQYWCVETLLFVVAVEHFKKIEESEREKEAKKIFRVFLQAESQLFVNVNENEVRKVASEMEAGNYSPQLFEGCYKDVHSQLEGVLLRWKTTSDYRNVLQASSVRRESSSSKVGARTSLVQMGVEGILQV